MISTSLSESGAAAGSPSVGLTCRFRPLEVADFLFVFAVDARAFAERPDAGGRLVFAELAACACTLRSTSASMSSVEFHAVIVVHSMANLCCLRLSWSGRMDTAWAMLDPP
jgi:hypothetical protein